MPECTPGTIRPSLRSTSLLMIILAAGSAIGTARAADEARPNIVLMMADDQGWGETGYNGHPYLKTPVLDEMAESTLLFERFYSAAPVCSPTRTSILTGRHPCRSGVFGPNWCTRPEEITIARILHSAGYRTGHFGKWHVGAVKADCPVNPARMGYDEYLAHDNFFEMNPPLSHNGADPEIIQGESSDIIVTAAEEFVREACSANRPFFVTIWFGSPHAPYSGLPEDVDLYADVPSEALRLRFAEITATDRSVGRFRQTLRDLDVSENTLLWYTSDNGITRESIPEDERDDLYNGQWRGTKGSLYEGGLRVPAMIEWPAVISRPRSTPVACVSSDIFTTLLDLLDLESPDPDRPVDGISLRDLIVNDSMDERPQPIGFWKYPGQRETEHPRWIDPELTRGTTPTTRNPGIDFRNHRHPVAATDNFAGQAAWTGNRYKLLVGVNDGESRAELYDLDVDPGELRDVSSEHPEVVREMSEDLADWRRSVEISLTGADY